MTLETELGGRRADAIRRVEIDYLQQEHEGLQSPLEKPRIVYSKKKDLWVNLGRLCSSMLVCLSQGEFKYLTGA